MKYYLKRGKWCVRDGTGLRKFRTEGEARAYVEKQEGTFVPKNYGEEIGEEEKEEGSSAEASWLERL